MTRYAIYWVPERNHPLWSAGCHWLGRDAERRDVVLPARPGTEAPRRYGFHATLKAPMQLREDRTVGQLLDAVQAVANDLEPFPMPTLGIGMLQDFIALQPVLPVRQGDALQVLADRCVIALDAFRDDAMADDMVRRSANVVGRQRELFDEYGYPFVLDEWRFHMTLSDALAHDAEGFALRDTLLRDARAHFASALSTSLVANEIAIFVERSTDGAFTLVERVPLNG